MRGFASLGQGERFPTDVLEPRQVSHCLTMDFLQRLLENALQQPCSVDPRSFFGKLASSKILIRLAVHSRIRVLFSLVMPGRRSKFRLVVGRRRWHQLAVLREAACDP